jgi:hypothetical protein
MELWAGQSLSFLKRGGDKSSRSSNKLTARLCENTEDLGHSNFKEYTYAQSYFESMPYNRFRLFFDSESKNFVGDVEKGSTPLKQFVTIHTGVRSNIGQKNVVSLDKQGDTWKRGLISGSEIHRYSLKYGGHFINIDPKLLASGGFDPEVELNDKLLIRQTGDSLIATVDCEKFYHLNNIHAIAPIEPVNTEGLKYILAILNSKLMNHYYHLISLEFGRAMAQTDIETLELLPIKEAPREQKDLIVNLVNTMLSLNKELLNADTKENVGEIQARILDIDNKLDSHICQLYGISL